MGVKSGEGAFSIADCRLPIYLIPGVCPLSFVIGHWSFVIGQSFTLYRHVAQRSAYFSSFAIDNRKPGNNRLVYERRPKVSFEVVLPRPNW